MKLSRLFLTTSATALAMAAFGSANAATVTSSGGTSYPSTPAAELFGSGAVNLAAGGVRVTLSGSTPASFLVDFNLSNGASWADALVGGPTGNVTVACAAATTAPTVALVSGGAETASTVTFRIDGAASCVGNDTLSFSFGIDGATALSSPSQSVVLTGTIRDNLSTIDGGFSYAAGSGLTLLTSASGTNLSAAAASTITISVASANTKFADAGTGTLVATLGTLTLSNGTAEEDDLATPWSTGAGDATATATITLTGDFAAATGTSACATGVYLDLATDICAATKTATSATINLTNADIVALRTAGATPLVMTVNGTTELSPVTVKADVAIDFGNTAYKDDTFSSNLNVFIRDGYNATAEFVLAAANNGSGYTSRIRIRNTSTVAGVVRLTLSSDTGTSATALVPATLNGTAITGLDGSGRVPAGGAIELTNSQIEAITGVTIPAGRRGRLTVNGEFQTGSIQPYFITPGGGMLNAEWTR